MADFWDITPYSPVEPDRRFGDIQRPDDVRGKHIWYVSQFLPAYTAQNPRRQTSS
jgi:hypothetical protein